MNVKKVLSVLIAGVLVIVVAIGFTKAFAFEKNKNNKVNADSISTETIQQLYSYLPIEDNGNKTTMYNASYTTFSSLSYDTALSTVYNYIARYDSSKMQTLTFEELKSQTTKASEYTPLYKITLENFEAAGKMVFGSEVKMPRTKFSINNELQAIYVEDEGYYVYRTSDVKEDSFFIEKKLNQYTITDEGNTIIIYDYFTMCTKNSTTCYNDTKAEKENAQIKNNEGTTNFIEKIKYVAKYKHVFKYEDGHFYWYSSELEN